VRHAVDAVPVAGVPAPDDRNEATVVHVRL
jgi:hypothetical protein